jgi:hypothetical protein
MLLCKKQPTPGAFAGLTAGNVAKLMRAFVCSYERSGALQYAQHFGSATAVKGRGAINNLIYRLKLLGWQNQQIADLVDVHRNTISNECTKIPELEKMCKNYHDEMKEPMSQAAEKLYIDETLAWTLYLSGKSEYRKRNKIVMDNCTFYTQRGGERHGIFRESQTTSTLQGKKTRWYALSRMGYVGRGTTTVRGPLWPDKGAVSSL